MSLTEYETTVVMRPDVIGDAVEGTLDRVREVVQTGGGKLLAINHWGRKRLAYPIAKHNRGLYVHTQYLGGSSLVAELERNLRISDNVLRYLTVQLAKDIDPNDRQMQEYVKPQYDIDEPEETVSEDTGRDRRVDGDDDERWSHHRDRDDAEPDFEMEPEAEPEVAARAEKDGSEP